MTWIILEALAALALAGLLVWWTMRASHTPPPPGSGPQPGEETRPPE